MNEDLKAKIVRAALLKKYQTEEIFVLKTAQFQGEVGRCNTTTLSLLLGSHWATRQSGREGGQGA